MKKISLIALAAICSTSAFADWTAAGVESDGTHYYDASTIQAQGPYKTMLVSLVPSKPTPEYDKKVMFFQAACGTNTVRYSESYYYKDNTLVKKGGEGNSPFTPISKGGEGAAVDQANYSAVCGG